MPKARTRAEEALAKWQRAWLTHCDVMPSSLADAAIGIKSALEALLAEPAPAPSGAVREAWMDSARQFARNEAYYRGLIETALKDVPDAYLCDDGTRSEDVLCAKLPDIVAALLAPSPPAVDAVREAAERLRHSLTPPRSTTDDGMLLVRAEDVEAVLRALAAQGAGGANPDIPDSCRVDEDGCCLVCGRDVEGCYACSHAAGLPLAPPPAPPEFRCTLPSGGYYHREPVPPAPAKDEVREAAEAVSQTYYEIAAEAIGEDKAKAEFSRRFEERLSKRRDAKRGGE